MFKKVTQKTAKQLDPAGKLVPVHSIFDQDHFRPLCLVRKKRKALFQPSPRYTRTEYRLLDVLLPGKGNDSAESLLSSGDSQDLGQFTATGSVSDRVDGTLSVPLDTVQVQLGGTASLSKQWHITVKKKSIEVSKLEALRAERKINLKHSFIQQLRKAQHNLYVVHETAETTEEATYEESTEAEARLMAQLYAKFSAKGTTERKRSITIPKGCTLAFRAIPLTIKDAEWGINYCPEDCLGSFFSDGSVRGELEELETEVQRKCYILSRLSVDLNIIFLKSIKAVMRDRNLREELAQKMEAVLDDTDNCDLTTQSPDLKDLLSKLQFSSSCLLLNVAGAISYTLDAFSELTEDQLLLLLESLEEKIVSQQLKLVKSILEQRPGTASSTLSFSGEKEQELTTAMLEMSGVEVQNGAAVCQQENSLAALCVALYVLDLLSTSG